MWTRTAVASACVIVAFLPAPTLAATHSDSQFPQRPVRLIVPTAPSGGTDFVARVMALRLTGRWGQSVVVDNRAGASGIIGIELGARAAPDGYTLSVFNSSHMITAQQSNTLSFERSGDFTAIAHSGTTENILVVHPKVPAKSVTELVEFARAKPRYLTYASGGVGSISHLGMELFRSMSKIEITHVPYKGSGQSLPDLLSGQVQLILTAVITAKPYVQTGRLRALAITGAKRLPALSEVPTFAEIGYPRYEASAWYGLFGPKRMPASLVASLNADLNGVVQQPEVADLLAGAGIDPGGKLSSAQFAEYIATTLVTWNDALKAAGMR